MESMSSNLNASLPLNVEEDAELTDRFKESALAITALFKHAQKSRKAAFAQGYHSCVSDLRDYIRSNAEPERPMTVGLIFDYLESRQSQLFRDLDVTSVQGTTHNVRVSTNPAGGNKPAKSPSPSSTNGTTHPRSPGTKRPSPRPGNMASSPPRIAPWASPSLSPTPLAEPAWSDLSSAETPKPLSTGWPEISILPTLPVSPAATFSNVLPSIGAKRKRDALVDVDPRNAGNVHNGDLLHRRNHGSSKKRKGNGNKGGKSALGLVGNSEDWVMDLDDDITGRERKRPRA